MDLPPRVSWGIGTAHAFTYVEISLEELTKKASRVLVATPIESRSQWEDSGGTRRIVTYYRLRVDDDIVGSGDQQVWVRVLGGIVDGIGQRVSGSVQMTMSKPSLLFLSKGQATVFHVTAMRQGHFPIVRTNNQATIATHRIKSKPLRRVTQGRPASVLEGLNIQQARKLIVEAHRKHEK